MGLIVCPDCGKQISDKATACPQCGCPIKEVKNVKKVDDGMSAIRGYDASAHPVKRKDSVLSIVAAVLSIFTVTALFGLIVGAVDLGAFSKDGKRHLGSWFAVIWGLLAIILLHGRVPIILIG